MELKIKNLNIMGVHCERQILEGGATKKLKRWGLRQFADLKGA